ncbi:LptA/OstA family protein [Planctomycetota bacterium]
MGLRAKRLLITVFLIIASCGRDAENTSSPSQEDSTFFRTKASSFEWIRSTRDTVSSSLRKQWILKGSHASEILEQEETVHIEIKSPFIEYFPSPGAGHNRVTVMSPEGIFREKVQDIAFSPAAMIHVFRPGTKHVHICMVTSDLHHDIDKNILTSSGTFIINTENGIVNGKNLHYSLNTNVARIEHDTHINLSKPAPQYSIETLPPFIEEDVHAFLENQYYLYAEENGQNTFTVASTGPTSLDFSTSTVIMNGPVVFSSKKLLLRADTMNITASESAVHTSSEITLRTIHAKGNIFFREQTGEKREVTCGNLWYDLHEDIIIMTGNPVMKSTSTTITSARMKYYPRNEEFVFAKPFRIERTAEPEKKKNSHRDTENTEKRL